MSWESLWYGPRGLRTMLAAPALAPLSWLYAAGVAARNATFSLGLRRPVRVDGATVVSVGNLVVGGAGKTPVTIFLARWAQACGRRVAVLSRGYGRRAARDVHFNAGALPGLDEVGDEPRLIARRCPGVEVWVGARRAPLALEARRHGADFLLLDDGFQHRQLHRDVDLVVWSGAGNGHRLPWGPLREAPAALSRASVVWSEAPVPASFGRPSVLARSRVAGLVNASGELRPAGELGGRDVVLLTGIARPGRVVQSLEALRAKIVAQHVFADHHPFSDDEVRAVDEDAARRGALVITTEKDLERLPRGTGASALRLEVEVTEGLAALAQALGLDVARVPPPGG